MAQLALMEGTLQKTVKTIGMQVAWTRLVLVQEGDDRLHVIVELPCLGVCSRVYLLQISVMIAITTTKTTPPHP